VSIESVNYHAHLLVSVATPPNVEPDLSEDILMVSSILGMVKLIPGIPFANDFDGDPICRHTIACAQMLDSLSYYPDFKETLSLSVKLAKLTWGCPAHRSSPKIDLIYSIPGLKEKK
jgi:hypothetical protein